MVLPTEGRLTTCISCIASSDSCRGAAGVSRLVSRGRWHVPVLVVESTWVGESRRSCGPLAGHGGSKWKVFEETSGGLKWKADADEFGTFLVGKHKSPVGDLIPWKELNGAKF